jgi:hypothetical protein
MTERKRDKETERQIEDRQDRFTDGQTERNSKTLLKKKLVLKV